jgi:hypothetical protein
MNDPWEILEYVGETLVFFGVVGEVFAEWREPHRTKLGRVSSLVLVVGLALSLAALIATNESFNHKIAELNLQAAGANERAENAEKTAKGYEAQISTANSRTATNEMETARLRKEAEDERMKRVLLESQLQQRHLSKEQEAALLKALNDSPLGGDVVIGTMPLDGEAKIYAQDFHDVLLGSPKWRQSAAWTIVDNFELPGSSFDPWGISIRCDSDSTCAAASRLALAFKKAGFTEPPVVNTPYRLDVVVLLIGRQPTIDQLKQKTTK